MTIHVNQVQIIRVVSSQSKFNDYLIVIDLYEIFSRKMSTKLRNYIVCNSAEGLKAYQNTVKLKREAIDELYALGITENEQSLVEQLCYLSNQIESLQQQAIFEFNSHTNLTNIPDILFSNSYIELVDQHNAVVQTLKESINVRMTSEIKKSTTMLNISFFFMSFLAAFVPILLFLNAFKTNKFSDKLQYEKEIQDITLKNVADGIIAVDTTGIVTVFNPAAENITGYSAIEAIGRNIYDLIRFKNYSDGLCEDICKSSKLCIKHIKRQFLPIIDKDGNEKNVVILCSKVRQSDCKVGVVFTIRDVTEKIVAHKEKEKNLRIEALGRLAGGLAHDFNNSLTIIGGHASLSKVYLNTNKHEKVEPSLDTIEQEVKNAQRTTGKLLTFARGGMPVKRQYRIEKLLNDSINLALKDTSIIRSIKSSCSDILVDVDYQQIVEVFTSILENAKEAMNKEGCIWIELEEVIVDDSIEGLLPGKYVLIQIINDGDRISAMDLDNIFEPYFSTKGSKGLGLPASYSIIKNHNGHINANSDEQQTTFTIYLPIIQTVNNIQPTEPKKNFRKYKILIMDDEEKIRDVTKNLIIELGHEAETAATGEEAIEKYKQNLKSGSPYDLLILDLMVLTGMGGKEALAQIHNIDPNAKAIVCSGYSNDSVIARHKKYGFIDYLPKPFTVTQLQETLNRIEPSCTT